MALPIALIAGVAAPALKALFDYFKGDLGKVGSVVEAGTHALGGAIESALERDDQAAARVEQALQNNRDFMLKFYGAFAELPEAVKLFRGIGIPTMVIAGFLWFAYRGIIPQAEVVEVVKALLFLSLGAGGMYMARRNGR